MGPEEDFARLEELGFVRKGFIPPPNEGQTFVCLRSGWMIGVPFLAGPYVVLPRDGDPTEVSSLGAAISDVQNAPPLPTAEREALRRSLEDRRPIARRAEEELARLQHERHEIREEMKSPEYQQMWREWNRFLLAGARGETPDLSAYDEAKRAYIEAKGRGQQKEEKRREQKKRRPRKRVTGRPGWTPERFDPSDLPGLLVALPVAIAMALLAEWMFIYVFAALSAFVAAVDVGGVLAIAGGAAFGFAAWSWTSLSRALTMVVSVAAFWAVTVWLDFASWLDFPALASVMPAIGAGWASLATRELPPPRLAVSAAVPFALVGAVVVVLSLSLGDGSGVLPDEHFLRALWLLLFASHGVLAAVPAAELAWYWTRER